MVRGSMRVITNLHKKDSCCQEETLAGLIGNLGFEPVELYKSLWNGDMGNPELEPLKELAVLARHDFDRYGEQLTAEIQKLIDDGIMAIMAGHISFPAYQKETLNGEYLPATLSPELLTGLLKGTFGFKGVIVSDALNMAGISGYYENQLETEMACFKAGTDILLWPSLEFIDTLEARILRKEISEERLNDAVSRVWNMKKKLGLFDDGYEVVKPVSEDLLVGHRSKATEIIQKSMTLVDNRNNLLPLDTLTSKKMLLCVVSDGDQQAAFTSLKEALQAKGFEVDIRSNLSFFSHGHELN